jgi:hypothetical protein
MAAGAATLLPEVPTIQIEGHTERGLSRVFLLTPHHSPRNRDFCLYVIENNLGWVEGFGLLLLLGTK